MHFFIFEDLRVIFHRLLTSMQENPFGCKLSYNDRRIGRLI